MDNKVQKALALDLDCFLERLICIHEFDANKNLRLLDLRLFNALH